MFRETEKAVDHHHTPFTDFAFKFVLFFQKENDLFLNLPICSPFHCLLNISNQSKTSECNESEYSTGVKKLCFRYQRGQWVAQPEFVLPSPWVCHILPRRQLISKLKQKVKMTCRGKSFCGLHCFCGLKKCVWRFVSYSNFWHRGKTEMIQPRENRPPPLCYTVRVCSFILGNPILQ